MLSTSAGSPVQIKSNTNDKLLKLAKHCKNNFNGQIQMDKLYRLMYDSALYELAYKKLQGCNINPVGESFSCIQRSTLNIELAPVAPLYIEGRRKQTFCVASKPYNHHPLAGSAEVLSEVIEGIIAELKNCSFRFEGKKVKTLGSKSRFSCIQHSPPFRDKLVQEVMRMILEVIFEPTFSEHSHGFRPGRGCHSALKEIKAQALNFGVST